MFCSLCCSCVVLENSFTWYRNIVFTLKCFVLCVVLVLFLRVLSLDIETFSVHLRVFSLEGSSLESSRCLLWQVHLGVVVSVSVFPGGKGATNFPRWHLPWKGPLPWLPWLLGGQEQQQHWAVLRLLLFRVRQVQPLSAAFTWMGHPAEAAQVRKWQGCGTKHLQPAHCHDRSSY